MFYFLKSFNKSTVEIVTAKTSNLGLGGIKVMCRLDVGQGHSHLQCQGTVPSFPAQRQQALPSPVLFLPYQHFTVIIKSFMFTIKITNNTRRKENNPASSAPDTAALNAVSVLALPCAHTDRHKHRTRRLIGRRLSPAVTCHLPGSI